MNDSKNPIVYREAKESDLEGVIKVNHLSQRSKKTSGLIQKRTLKDFHKLFDISKRFIIAEQNGVIIGYVIVLDESAEYLENEIFSFFPKNYDNFVFVDSVAVHPDFRRKKVAKGMYNRFLSEEKKRVLVDFLIKPRNSESISFHESMGFKSIGDRINLKNGMVAEVYEYKTNS